MVFLLDADTGTVTWGEYEVSASLTHDQFVQKYPQIPLVREKHDPNLAMLTYQLPSMLIHEQEIVLQPRFFNQYFESIHIERLASVSKTGQDRALETWWREELEWLHSAREIVRTQLGRPHLTETSELFDESRFYPKDYLDQLQDWEYKFSWGRAGISYLSEELVNRLWLGYKFSFD